MKRLPFGLMLVLLMIPLLFHPSPVVGSVSPPIRPRHAAIESVEVRAMAVHRDTLWTMTWEDGLLRWDTRTGTYERIFGAPGYAMDMEIAPDGKLWIADDTSLYSYDGISWTHYPAPYFADVVAIDDAGDRWVGSLGLYRFSADGDWTYYTNTDGLLGTLIKDIEVDEQDRKWIAAHEGLSVFDGTQWTTYSTATIGLDVIANIAIDSAGHTWATDGIQGVSRFDGTNWTVVPFPADRLYPHIRDVVGDALGNVWFATPALDDYPGYQEHRDSIAVYHPDGTWETFGSLDGLPYLDHACAAADDSGKVYFASLGFEHGSCFGAAGISVYTPGEGWSRLTVPGYVLYETGSSRLVVQFPASCAASIDQYESATVDQRIITQTSDLVQVEVVTHLPLTSSTPFPVDPQLIPPDIAAEYLGPVGTFIPADHPAVIATAHMVTRDTHTEVSAVEAIIGWTAENINYDLGWLQPGYPKVTPDPHNGLTVFQWRWGTCSGFSNVAVALLRAAGIPARVVHGHLISLDVVDAGAHAWIEVYYPDLGWVPSEPQGTANFADTHVRMMGGSCPLGTVISWLYDLQTATHLTSLGGDSVSAAMVNDIEHTSPLAEPTVILLVAQEGETDPVCASLNVRRTYCDWDMSVNGDWTAAVDQPWLGVSPGWGWVPGHLQVCANGSGLSMGRYVGHVTIADRLGATASVEVTLAVLRRQVYLPLVVR